MKNVRLTLASSLCALLMTVWSPLIGTAHGQSLPEPAAVISFSNIANTLKDVDYLVDASGYGQMKFMIQTQVNHFLKGIDQTQPAGVLLYMDEGAQQPSALGFVPVEDVEDLLDTLSGFAEVDEGDDYTTIITDDDKEILIKQVGKHAFFSDKPEMFERIPDDPAMYLENLPERFNVSGRVFGQRIPQELRDKAITMIREAYEQQLEQMDDLDDAAAELQRKSFEINMKQIESMIQETDQVAMGMLIDEENKTISGEFEIVGLEGSQLAERSNINAQPQPTQFGGFQISGSVFNAVSRMLLTPQDIEQYDQLSITGKDAIVNLVNEEADLTEAQMDVVKTAIDDLFAAANETLADGVMDVGMVAQLEKGNINFASGVLFSDPGKVESVVKNLTTEFENLLKESGTSVQLNAETHNGVTLHKITTATPDDEEELVDAVGAQFQIVFGIGKDAAYVAAGSDPTSLLKKAIDGSGSDAAATLGQYNFFIAPLLNFAAQMQPDQPMLAPFAEKMAEEGNDRLQYELKTIKNGFNVRMDLQDGFMSLIQIATEAIGQGMNGGNDF